MAKEARDSKQLLKQELATRSTLGLKVSDHRHVGLHAAWLSWKRLSVVVMVTVVDVDANHLWPLRCLTACCLAVMEQFSMVAMETVECGHRDSCTC